MRTTVKIVPSFMLIMLSATLVEAKGWRGIIPLRSSRKEVERQIGPPAKTKGSVYKLKDEVVMINYSTGKCDDIRVTSWAVPRNTVISITVNPRSRMKLRDLGFNLDNFKRLNDPEVEDAVYFVSEGEGISIISRPSDDVVISIIYGPSNEDKNLHCSRPAMK